MNAVSIVYCVGARIQKVCPQRQSDEKRQACQGRRKAWSPAPQFIAPPCKQQRSSYERQQNSRATSREYDRESLKPLLCKCAGSHMHVGMDANRPTGNRRRENFGNTGRKAGLNPRGIRDGENINELNRASDCHRLEYEQEKQIRQGQWAAIDSDRFALGARHFLNSTDRLACARRTPSVAAPGRRKRQWLR